MEAIDTVQLNEVLMVLKSADVRRFKCQAFEVEFSAAEVEDEANAETETTAVGFEQPTPRPMPPKKEEEDDSPPHLPPQYRRLFGNQVPRFQPNTIPVADNAER